MGLLEKIGVFPILIELKKLKSRLFNNPELRARAIYEFCREQPLETRKYLQTYVFDLPLTKSVKPDYSSESSD
jgi:hypothetical protein